MVKPLKPLEQSALGDRIADDLCEQIISRQIPPGTHLTESSLAQSYGVSRGPVRDALRTLEFEGLAQSRTKGVYTLPFDVTHIPDLYSLRQAIETMAARLLSQRASESDWEAFRASLKHMDEASSASNIDLFAAADAEFHNLIYLASGHRQLIILWRQCAPIFTTLMRITTASDSDLQSTYLSHVSLLEVIQRDTPQQIEQYVTKHIEQSCKNMLDAYASRFQTIHLEHSAV